MRIRYRVAPVAQPADDPEVLARFHQTLSLVDKVAGQIMKTLRGSFRMEDLVAAGREGLLDAARRYDPGRGVPFRAYAAIRVRGEIMDSIRAQAPMPRAAYERLRGLRAMYRVAESITEDASAPQTEVPSAEQADQLLSDHLANMATAMAVGLLARPARGDENEIVGVSASRSPEENAAKSELMNIIIQELDSLAPQEAELVRRHYLEGDPFDQVAHELGLSKSWASRLHTRAIARLSKRLRSMKVTG